MTMNEMPDLSRFFGVEGVNEFLSFSWPFPRAIFHWPSDLYKAMTQSKSLRDVLFLIYGHDVIFERTNRNKAEFWFPFEEAKEMGLKEYKKRLDECLLLHRGMKTIQHMEAQQGAMERQVNSSASDPAFQHPVKELPREFVEELEKIRSENKISRPSNQKQQAKDGQENQPKCDVYSDYESFWEKCRVQPITSAILPVLFTMFLREAPMPRVSGYMKYKNRKLSQQNQEAIVTVYRKVKTLVRSTFLPYGKQKVGRYVPVFDWDKIEQRFLEYHKIEEKDWPIVKEHFDTLKEKNGPPKDNTKNIPYRQEIEALAKLCNLNSCLAYNLHTYDYSERQLPPALRKALSMLENGELLPKVEVKEQIGVPPLYYYLNDLYQNIDSQEFSDFVFLCYYRLPLSTVASNFWGVSNIIQMLQQVTHQYALELLEDFEKDRGVVVLQYQEKDNLVEQASLTAGHEQYAWDRKDLIRASELICKLMRKFDKSGFLMFIENYHRPENFRLLLRDLFEKYDMAEYRKLTPRVWYYTEQQAFPLIIQLVESYLAEEFTVCLDRWARKEMTCSTTSD